VLGNFVRNVNGPFPRGQMAQFDAVSGANNVSATTTPSMSEGKVIPRMSSIFSKARALRTRHPDREQLSHGDPIEGSTDKSANGSGIMLGDYGGSHIFCRKNVIISAGQVGLGVAGGSFIRVEDNLILDGNRMSRTTALRMESKQAAERPRYRGS